MKKFLLFILIIFFPVGSWAANYYVTLNGVDTKTGADWAHAKAFADLDTTFWASLESGSSDHYLYLSGGTVSVTYPNFNIRHNTATNHLYIRPGSASPITNTGHTGQVIFTAATNSIRLGDTSGGTASYVIFNGETSTGAGTRNMKIDVNGQNYKAIDDYNTGAGNQLLYTEVTGAVDPCAEEHLCALDVVGGINVYKHNWFHGNKGNNDMDVAGSASAYSTCEISYNLIESGTDNYIKNPRGCDIHHNTFNCANATFKYDILHFESGTVEYLRLYNNVFTDCESNTFLELDPAVDGTLNHIRIFNNIYNNGGDSGDRNFTIKTSGTGTLLIDDMWIFNNTFANANGQSMCLYMIATAPTTITNSGIVNNILNNCNNFIDSSYSSFTFTDAGFNFKNNIVYNASGYSLGWINSGAYKEYTTFCTTGGGCTWISDHPTQTGNVNSAPLFTSTSDFSLQVGSPAIGAGVDLSTMTSMTGLSSTWPFDYNDVTRSGAWTIGAYQGAGGGGGGIPVPVTGIHIVGGQVR